MTSKDIRVIIPAYNEDKAIGSVLEEIPKFVKEIIVVDNGSSDKTYEVAQTFGATSIKEPRKGYGQACLKGIEYLKNLNEDPDVVVFVDGDHSDYPEEMLNLIEPILEKEMDLVIGSRSLGKREKGSMTLPQVFGNWLATSMIRWFYGVKYTDLGPFRAIKYNSLLRLEMADTNYGWTVEMQLKAAKQNMKTMDVPVNYRKRIGTSKVSGTLTGVIGAGYKIIYTIFRYL